MPDNLPNNPYYSQQSPDNQSMWQGVPQSMYGGSEYQRPYTPSPFAGAIGPGIDQTLQQLLPQLLQGLVGQNYLARNPFAPSTFANHAVSLEMNQKAMRLAMQARAMNSGIAQIENSRISGIANMLGFGGASTDEVINNITSNPLVPMAAAMFGFDIYDFMPNLGIGIESAKMFGRSGMTVSPEDLNRFTDTFAGRAGMSGGKYVSPTKAQGFTPAAQLRIASVLRMRGLASIDGDKFDEFSTNNPGLDARAAALYSDSESVIRPAAMLRDLYGINDPSAQIDAIQRLTGAGAGRVSSGDMSRQIAKIKEVTDASGVSFQALTSIIDTANSLAMRAGLSTVVASRTALDSVIAGHSVASGFTESLRMGIGGGSFLTPGISRSADDYANLYTSNTMSAQASPIAGRIAAILGTTGSDRSNDPIIQAAYRARAGRGTAEDYNLLRNPLNVANALSQFSGQSVADIMQRFDDVEYTQQIIEANPGIASSVRKMQAFSVLSQSARGSRVAAFGLNDDEYVNVVSAVRSTPANMSTAEKRKYLAGFSNVAGISKIAGIANDKEFESAYSLFTSNAIRSGYGVSDAILNLFEGKIDASISTLTNNADTLSEVLGSMGGLPATEEGMKRIFDALKEGDFRGLVATPKSEMTNALLVNSGGIKNMLWDRSKDNEKKRKKVMDIMGTFLSPEDVKALDDAAATGYDSDYDDAVADIEFKQRKAEGKESESTKEKAEKDRMERPPTASAFETKINAVIDELRLLRPSAPVEITDRRNT